MVLEIRLISCKKVSDICVFSPRFPHFPLDKMAAISHFRCIFVKEMVCIVIKKFIESNADPILWRIYASLGGGELILAGILVIHRLQITGSLYVQSHYNDVIMDVMASQITIVYLMVYSGADQRKHQSPASLAFVRGIQRSPVNCPHKMASNAENVSIWWRHRAAR